MPTIRVKKPFEPDPSASPKPTLPVTQVTEINPEFEEKPLSEPASKTSEEYHGGSELSFSMPDTSVSSPIPMPTSSQSSSSSSSSSSDQSESTSPSPTSSETSTSEASEQQQQLQPDSSSQQSSEEHPESSSPSSQTSISTTESPNQQQSITSSSSESQQQSSPAPETETTENSQTPEASEQTSESSASSATEQQQSSQMPEASSSSEASTTTEVSEQQSTNSSVATESAEPQQGTESQANEQTEEDGEEEENEEDNEEEEDEEIDDEEEEEDEDQAYSYTFNTQQAFDVTDTGYVDAATKYYQTEFYRFIEMIAEEKTKFFDPYNAEEYNVKKLMFRQFEKKPLSYYRMARIREAVILILDNSGSMKWWARNIHVLASLAMQRNDVEVYLAPNGIIEEMLHPKRARVSHDDVVKKLRNRKIIYVGDFDGANTAVELSWFNDVIWICPESRYRHFMEHDWVSYSEDKFKGAFLRVFTLEQMFSAFRKLLSSPSLKIWYDLFDEYVSSQEDEDEDMS